LMVSNGLNSEKTTEATLLEKYLSTSIIDNPDLRKHVHLYNVCLEKCNQLLEEELNKNQ
jgi:hypothetical protein